MKKKVKRFTQVEMYVEDGAFIPTRAHELDAGLDLRTRETIEIPPHGSVVVDTGVHFRIPEGWFGKLESKSGLNVTHGVFCAGGVIDSGYTGSIKCRLYNFNDDRGKILEKGDKCVQIVFLPISAPELIKVDTIKDWESERGDNGFGSTGR